MDEIQPGEGLGPESFYSLYLGGLSFEDRSRRLHASYVVLLSGRLGLRPGELQHLHEGWVDWEQGTIRVPDHEPCGCQACLERARSRVRAGDGRSVGAVLESACWSPPAETGARTIVFGWSDRLAVVLAAFFSETAYLSLSVSAMQSLVTEAATNAMGLEASAVDLARLRASAGSFLADAGFDTARLADLLGVDVEVARSFARREGGHARDHFYRALDDTDAPDICGEDPTYPLVCDPAPFDREPFDPTNAPDRRQDRAGSRRVVHTSPRPDATPGDVDFDPTDQSVPDHLDADSDLVEDDVASTLGQWVDRRDADRETAADTAATDSGARAGATDGGGGAAAADAGGTDAPVESGPEPEQDPRDAVTEPVVASVSTTFASANVRGGKPVSGKVLVGQEEVVLLAIRDEEVRDHYVVSFDQMSDVAIDKTPSAVADVFDSTVGIVYEDDGNRNVTVVELPGKKRFDFSSRLFRLLLDGLPVVTTHPARTGGRVTDEDPAEGDLSLESRKLSVSDGEDDPQFGILLPDVIHVERGAQTLGENRYRGLLIRHLQPDGQAITTAIAPQDKDDVQLLERFVMRHYRERKQQAQATELSADQKEVLVALYSTGGGMDLSMIIDIDSAELSELLGSLEGAGLIRNESGGATLTGMGQMLVSDKVDDVNV